MKDWKDYWPYLKTIILRVPAIAWAVFGMIAVSLVAVFALQAAGPAYVVIYDGLTPADGGKVIAELQKLGIPYELQAAGNLILVPESKLSSARLQLGSAGIPENKISSGWDKLENAPMTVSDLAQSTMAMRALEEALADTIDNMRGISSAQVYLALPATTPFLEDQPKPTASVIMTATNEDAKAQGSAIAKLVAGAVTGLNTKDVNVATTSGLIVFPTTDGQIGGTELSIIHDVEAAANIRIIELLTPLIGNGNFRSDVAADVDFTQSHIHQISYGPNKLIIHDINSQSTEPGNQLVGFGIPGAMSNEPPSPTNAIVPTESTQNNNINKNDAFNSKITSTQTNISSKKDQTYVTDVSDDDVTKPNWTVKSIAVSLVLNKAALGNVTSEEVKKAIAGAFAYPQVTVNVLAAPFQAQKTDILSGSYIYPIQPITRVVLELLAAVAFLFGIAVPFGRRLATVGFYKSQSTLSSKPMPASLPPPDFSGLKDIARANPAGVARLLQNWADENE